jgi:hypothetical protein
MSLSRKLQQRKAVVLSDKLEKLQCPATAKIPWVARAVFQILATDLPLTGLNRR